MLSGLTRPSPLSGLLFTQLLVLSGWQTANAADDKSPLSCQHLARLEVVDEPVNESIRMSALSTLFRRIQVAAAERVGICDGTGPWPWPVGRAASVPGAMRLMLMPPAMAKAGTP